VDKVDFQKIFAKDFCSTFFLLRYKKVDKVDFQKIFTKDFCSTFF